MLDGDVAVVTGGTSGIGRAISQTFADHGATVVVTDITEEPRSGAQPTAEAIEESGGEATFVEADVTDHDEMLALADTVVEKYGSLDVMVNNAGILAESKLHETNPENWNKVIDINVNGVYHGMKAALTHMTEQESGGSVVNISSISGKIGRVIAPAYCTSKGAVTMMTRQTAIDYGSENLRINAVAPGGVLTEMARQNMADERREYLEGRTPMGRLASPEEVGKVAVFLSSDLASYVNGHVLVADGGFSIA